MPSPQLCTSQGSSFVQKVPTQKHLASFNEGFFSLITNWELVGLLLILQLYYLNTEKVEFTYPPQIKNKTNLRKKAKTSKEKTKQLCNVFLPHVLPSIPLSSSPNISPLLLSFFWFLFIYFWDRVCHFKSPWFQMSRKETPHEPNSDVRPRVDHRAASLQHL